MEFIKNIFGFGSDNAPSSSSKTEEQKRAVADGETRRSYVARVQPLLQDCPQDGGRHKDQGLEWFRTSLRRDEDDDYAHGFLDENTCFVESQKRKK